MACALPPPATSPNQPTFIDTYRERHFVTAGTETAGRAVPPRSRRLYRSLNSLVGPVRIVLPARDVTEINAL